MEYEEINVQGESEQEKKLKEVTGTAIVPAFIFKSTKLLFMKETKVLIGFGNNRSEIEKLIEKLK